MTGRLSRKLAPLAELSTVASPPWASRGLAHDRKPEPGARLRAGRCGAIEAVEDPRLVLLGDAGPVIRDDDLAFADRHLDRSADGAVLDRVVEQVQHGALEQHRVGLHDGR